MSNKSKRNRNRKTRAINVGGRTRIVRRGSDAEKKYLSQGGTFGTQADYDKKNTYLKSLNKQGSPNYVPTGDEPMTDAQQIAGAITGEALKPEAPIPITTPQQTDTTNYGSILSQLQPPETPEVPTSAIGSTTGVTTPATNFGGDTQLNNFLKYLGLRKQAPDVEQIRQDTEKEAGINKYEKKVRRISNQLSAIKSNAEAQQLSVTGQGRGIPEAIIGGQQAQIAKEAAIASLPVAAELDVAQGDLEAAQSKFDSLFRIRVSDAENKVNEWNGQVDAIWGYFSDKEKEALADVKEEKKYQLSLARDASETASKLAFQYAASGDKATSDAILAIKPVDINKKGDVQRYQMELAKYGGGGKKVSSLASAVVDNPGLYFTLTPTSKETVVSELFEAGYDISNLQKVSLSSAQQEDVASMETVKSLIDDVLGSAVDGSIPGIGYGLGSLQGIGAQFGMGTDTERSVRANIGNIKGTIAKLRGGTSFTANEQRLLNSYVPSINDSSAVATTKLENLRKFIETKNKNLFGVSKINPTKGQIIKPGINNSAITPEYLRSTYEY